MAVCLTSDERCFGSFYSHFYDVDFVENKKIVSSLFESLNSVLILVASFLFHSFSILFLSNSNGTINASSTARILHVIESPFLSMETLFAVNFMLLAFPLNIDTLFPADYNKRNSNWKKKQNFFYFRIRIDFRPTFNLNDLLHSIDQVSI